jgi:hypothetical protein
MSRQGACHAHPDCPSMTVTKSRMTMMTLYSVYRPCCIGFDISESFIPQSLISCETNLGEMVAYPSAKSVSMESLLVVQSSTVSQIVQNNSQSKLSLNFRLYLTKIYNIGSIDKKIHFKNLALLSLKFIKISFVFRN